MIWWHLITPHQLWVGQRGLHGARGTVAFTEQFLVRACCAVLLCSLSKAAVMLGSKLVLHIGVQRWPDSKEELLLVEIAAHLSQVGYIYIP